MAEGTIRAEAIAALADLYADAAPSDLQVTEGWPGADLQDECAWFGDTTGTVTIPTMRTGRQAIEDTFTLPVYFMAAKPGQTAREARVRVNELKNLLTTVLAENPTMDDLDGVKWAAQLDTQFEETAVIGGEGYEGYATAYVQIKSRST